MFPKSAISRRWFYLTREFRMCAIDRNFPTQAAFTQVGIDRSLIRYSRHVVIGLRISRRAVSSQSRVIGESHVDTAAS